MIEIERVNLFRPRGELAKHLPKQSGATACGSDRSLRPPGWSAAAERHGVGACGEEVKGQGSSQGAMAWIPRRPLASRADARSRPAATRDWLEVGTCGAPSLQPLRGEKWRACGSWLDLATSGLEHSPLPITPKARTSRDAMDGVSPRTKEASDRRKILGSRSGTPYQGVTRGR